MSMSVFQKYLDTRGQGLNWPSGIITEKNTEYYKSYDNRFLGANPHCSFESTIFRVGSKDEYKKAFIGLYVLPSIKNDYSLK